MSTDHEFHFAPLREDDLAMLRSWLQRPHAAHWWGPTPSIAELREDYVTPAGEPNATRAHIAHLGGEPVGFIQSYVVMGSGGGWWEGETDPGARGIDQFLAEEARLGQGLGRRMIRAFLAKLFDDPAVTVVQTDPQPSNERAIRCYTAAGFRAVGQVDTPDGPALLMRCTRQTLAESLA
jgi:RimJ/RimL family protein N-acetyltransferase